jgi:hypothetical protein
MRCLTGLGQHARVFPGVCLSPSGYRSAVIRRMIGDLNMDEGSSRPAGGRSRLAAGTPMGNGMQIKSTVIARGPGAEAL